jgi:aconitate decarboxylase
MSLRYGVAAMLTDGNAFVDQYTAERVGDPALVELAGRVDVEHDERVDALGSDKRHTVTVSIATTDGHTLEGGAGHRRGSQFEPVAREEIVEKFRLLTKPLEGIDGEALLTCVLGLEELTDTEELARLLRPEEA